MIHPMDLTGKHFLVTGASSGLGRQTCITLSQLGARISLIARNENRLEETVSLMDGDGHSAFLFDVSAVDEIEDLIKRVVEKSGKLDGFVHAAGIGTSKPLSMTKHDFMQEMMTIHVYSFIELTRVMAKKKNSNDGASIVAISSASTISSNKGQVAYVAAKGALDRAVKPIAIELGESRKIRANTINPGWVKTNMYYSHLKELGQERMDEILTSSFLGAAEPEEIVNTIAFLLSDASTKITGQNIVVDGGWTIH